MFLDVAATGVVEPAVEVVRCRRPGPSAARRRGRSGTLAGGEFAGQAQPASLQPLVGCVGLQPAGLGDLPGRLALPIVQRQHHAILGGQPGQGGAELGRVGRCRCPISIPACGLAASTGRSGIRSTAVCCSSAPPTPQDRVAATRWASWLCSPACSVARPAGRRPDCGPSSPTTRHTPWPPEIRPAASGRSAVSRELETLVGNLRLAVAYRAGRHRRSARRRPRSHSARLGAHGLRRAPRPASDPPCAGSAVRRPVARSGCGAVR